VRPLRIGEEKQRKKKKTKKKKKEEEETTAAKYNGLPMGGHNNQRASR